MADLLAPFSTLFVQLGSRQIQYNFTDVQNALFQMPLMQAAVMFFIFYSSTKKLQLAAVLTICYYLTLFVLLNDKHPMNILPRFWLRREGFLEEEKQSKVLGSTSMYHTYTGNLKTLYQRMKKTHTSI